MKKKESISQNLDVGQSEEAKKFQSLVDKVLSVPKKEIDRREAELKKAKGN